MDFLLSLLIFFFLFEDSFSTKKCVALTSREQSDWLIQFFLSLSVFFHRRLKLESAGCYEQNEWNSTWLKFLASIWSTKYLPVARFSYIYFFCLAFSPPPQFTGNSIIIRWSVSNCKYLYLRCRCLVEIKIWTINDVVRSTEREWAEKKCLWHHIYNSSSLAHFGRASCLIWSTREKSTQMGTHPNRDSNEKERKKIKISCKEHKNFFGEKI